MNQEGVRPCVQLARINAKKLGPSNPEASGLAGENVQEGGLVGQPLRRVCRLPWQVQARRSPSLVSVRPRPY